MGRNAVFRYNYMITFTQTSMEIPLPTDAPLLEWEAPQRDHYTHGPKWYLGAGAFLLVCLAYAVWTSAWSFIALLVLMSVVYLLVHRLPPQNVRMRIWKNGYAVRDAFTKWEECTGYWMLQSALSTTLTIGHKKALSPFTKIQLAGLDPHQVNDVLEQFLPHIQNKKENLIDTIIHICKL